VSLLLTLLQFYEMMHEVHFGLLAIIVLLEIENMYIKFTFKRAVVS